MLSRNFFKENFEENEVKPKNFCMQSSDVGKSNVILMVVLMELLKI